MPCEYQDMFLEYKLFKQHISLYEKGVCRCTLERELERPTVEQLSSYAGGPHSAAAAAFFSEVPCHTDPCCMCNRPVLHTGNQQPGPESSITFQAFTFERLLEKQLPKINKFFNRSHQEYIATMNVSWAFSQTSCCCCFFLSTPSAGTAVLQLREIFLNQKKQQLHSRIHNLTKYERNRFLYIFMLYRSWMPWATKEDSGSKPTCCRSGDACGTLLLRWNFLQTSAIWITQVISCCLLLQNT